MMASPYFSLNRDSIFIRGARRAAIYQVSKGDVFSVDEAGREILELAGEGYLVEEIFSRARHAQKPDEVAVFLRQIEDLGLGGMGERQRRFGETHFTLPPKKLNKVWFELTTGCNLRCIHCYASASPSSAFKTRLKHARFKEAICEAASLGARWIQFIGGEPLLYEFGHLADLISTARNASFEVVEVFTNGTLLADAHIDCFSEQGVQVAVSLYSCDAHVHDRITGCPGSFDRTARTLERLRERGVPFRIGMVLTSLNAHTETKTLQWVAERLGDVVVTRDIVRCTQCGRNGQGALLTKDLLRRRVRATPDFPNTSRDMLHKALGSHSCLAGEVCVTADGEVYPCIMERTRILGNIETQRLADVVEGHSTQSVWGLSKDQVPVCRDCEYRYACPDCPPMSLALTEMLEGEPVSGPVKDPLCTYDPYTGTWGSPDDVLDRLCTRQTYRSGRILRAKGGINHG